LTAPTQPLDEPDLDALLANTTSDTSLETLQTIENSSYFGNSGLPVEAAASTASMTPSDLDFDLEGLNAENLDMPTTVARPPIDAPKLDFDNIDFDFLQEKDAARSPNTIAAPAFQSAPKPAPAPARDAPMEFSAADFSSPLPEIPGMAEPLPVAARAPEAAPAAPSMDFDLSDITLELDPSETKQAPAINFDNLHDIQTAQDDNAADYSNNAEMSTKLDLAVAYQEIGDKEGARELLDEVVKGGTPEQTDKAKSLLSKLA
jgi:pilus assembly protein FimV